MPNVESNPYHGVEFNIGGSHVFLSADLTQSARSVSIIGAGMHTHSEGQNFILLNFNPSRAGYSAQTQEKCRQRIAETLKIELSPAKPVYMLPMSEENFRGITDILMDMQLQQAKGESFVSAQHLRRHPEIKIMGEIAQQIPAKQRHELATIHKLKLLEAQIGKAIHFCSQTYSENRHFPEGAIRDTLIGFVEKLPLTEEKKAENIHKLIYDIKVASELYHSDQRGRGSQA